MPYPPIFQSVVQYLNGLGPDVTQDKFNGLYNSILWHWFPLDGGYIVTNVSLPLGARSKNVLVCHGLGPGGPPGLNPILVLKIKRPSKWTAAGRQTVMDELVDQIKKAFDESRHSPIYGLGAIGLHWMAFKMQSKDDQPTVLVDWQDDITSDASYASFNIIADPIHEMTSD